ncbi:MAG: hypothetical protein ACI8TE_000925 [Francisella sp.]|jgi:hypothetical protein
MLFSIVTRSIADISIILSELFLKDEAKVGVFSLIIMLSLFFEKVIIRIMYVVFLPKIAVLIGNKDCLGLRKTLNRNYIYFITFEIINSLLFIFMVILFSYLLSGYSVLGLSIGYLISVFVVYTSKYIYEYAD